MSGRSRRRRGAAGQALLVALLVLLIASLAAALVASDLMLRERALLEEGVRARLRTMLDGELATALARLAAGQPQPGGAREWSEGGTVEAERTFRGAGRYRILVRAGYAGRRAAAEAEVWVPPGGRRPLVLSWRRRPAALADAP